MCFIEGVASPGTSCGVACRRRRRRQKNASAAMAATAAPPTPAPMPALAPVLRPGEGLFVGCGLADVVVAAAVVAGSLTLLSPRVLLLVLPPLLLVLLLVLLGVAETVTDTYSTLVGTDALGWTVSADGV